MATTTIAAGDLDKRVKLEKYVESVDAGGYGNATQVWNGYADVWAAIETSGSREFYRASQVYTTMTHLVTVRYRSDVLTKHRLKFGTRYLNIVGIINPEQRNVILRLACEEAV